MTALEAFRAADNPVDGQLVTDLEKMVLRTKGETARLSERGTELYDALAALARSKNRAWGCPFYRCRSSARLLPLRR